MQYQRIVLIRTFLFIIARFYPLTRVFQIFYHRKKIIGKEAQQKHPDSIYYYRAKFLIIVTHVGGKNLIPIQDHPTRKHFCQTISASD